MDTILAITAIIFFITAVIITLYKVAEFTGFGILAAPLGVVSFLLSLVTGAILTSLVAGGLVVAAFPNSFASRDINNVVHWFDKLDVKMQKANGTYHKDDDLKWLQDLSK